MKSVIVTLGAFAGLAAAQNFLGLPECGQVCAGSMWGPAKAQELGCSPGDVACLCKNQNFIFGLRDCSSATCGGSEARQVVEFGIKACSDAGVQITDGSNTASGVSTIVSTLTSGQSTITTAVSTSTASSASGVSTESGGAVVSTVSNSESTFVTTLSTVTSSAEEASTTATETATETESATATESQTEGQTESGTATGTDGAAATTTTEGAAMPMRTLAPGAILGAGLAALLL